MHGLAATNYSVLAFVAESADDSPVEQGRRVVQKLTCDECGTRFNCGAPPGKDHCWCMELPNLRESFDLAGKCVCPDCMTRGKAKAMIRARKTRQRQRRETPIKIAR